MAASVVASAPLPPSDPSPCAPAHCAPKAAEPPAKRRALKDSREETAVESTFRFPLQSLPPELRHEIYSQLDYRSLISLSQVSKFFHETVDPQMAHPADKFAFVMHAENFFSQHFPGLLNGQEHPGNFACYICHRVRDPGLFDAEQPHSIYLDVPGSTLEDATPKDKSPEDVSLVADAASHDDRRDEEENDPEDETTLVVDDTKSAAGTATTVDESVQKATVAPPTVPATNPRLPPIEGIRRRIQVALRRFCIDCGVQKGLHNPGDLLVTKLRQELWVCNCRKVLQKPDCLKCPDCELDCPLRAKGKP